MSEKNLVKDKDIQQLTPTSVKGRHSIDTEMSSESLQRSYFPETEIVFVVHFLKIRC